MNDTQYCYVRCIYIRKMHTEPNGSNLRTSTKYVGTPHDVVSHTHTHTHTHVVENMLFSYPPPGPLCSLQLSLSLMGWCGHSQQTIFIDTFSEYNGHLDPYNIIVDYNIHLVFWCIKWVPGL